MKNRPFLPGKGIVLATVGIFLFSMTLLICCSADHDKGWSTYRHDGFRSGITNEMLPDNLSPQWVFKPAHAPAPAWHKPGEELPREHVDNTYHVVSANGLTYFGSTVDNKLYALNTSTGRIQWTFFAEGPLRFAPSIWKNRVYFGSDDGYAYCLNAKNGKLKWKYCAGPSAKKVIGNGNMISLWPIRTSVLVEEGVAYFAAGVFPYEGIYIAALDAQNGKVLWKNDTVGDRAHELQFGGISPFGYLLASKDHLYVPSGRNMPAVFDKHSGAFLYTLSPGSKAGGSWALIDKDKLIAGVDRSGTPAKIVYDLDSGRRKGDAFVSFDGIDMVVKGNASYVLTETGVDAIERDRYPQLEGKIDSLMAEIYRTNNSLRSIAQSSLGKNDNPNPEFDKLIAKNKLLKEKLDDVQRSTTRWQHKEHGANTLILANNKVVAGGKGTVVVLDSQNGREINRLKIEGRALGLAVSEGHLLVNDEKGYIYCFADGNQSLTEVAPDTIDFPFEKDERNKLYKTAADRILTETGISKGYCLVLGSGEGKLAFELARKSDLKIIGIDQDLKKVQMARKKLDKAGLYGSRIIFENWALESLPDYFANLIVSDDFLQSGKIRADPREIYRILKPYGGMVCLGQPGQKNSESDLFDKTALLEWMDRIGAEKPEASEKGGLWLTTKRGPLKGAGAWTHQYANPANTVCSDDSLVNYPFQVLWFGEPGPEKMVERHARASAPVAKNGRLFIEGENVVMAYDSYNGLKLWERDIPGANRVRVDVDGGNLAVSDQGLFVATGEKCLLLDAVTGKTLKTYKIPASPDGTKRRWGYIACSGNTLFGSSAKPFRNEYDYLAQFVTCPDESRAGNPLDPVSYFASQYPSKEAAEADFQRSGAKWTFITDYPSRSLGIVRHEPVTNRILLSDAVFALDISSGKTKWIHRGKEVAHITISIGDGIVYFADRAVTRTQKKQGVTERKAYITRAVWQEEPAPVKDKYADVRMVTALDAGTGAVKWQRPVDLSGCGGDAAASAYQDSVLLFFGSFGLHDKWRFGKGELRWHRVTALSAKNGDMLWSKPMNYMVRPVIVGNTIIIEPRACDLKTGTIKTRIHPITGKTVPWEYLRPGHTCAASSASPTCLFYRSYNAAFYDLAGDRGITYFGAIRPGCWINMIPANGLLLFPEASAGCTCSFPLRTSVVLKPAKPSETGDWTVFVSEGPITPVKRLGINLGAPGDKKDDKGNIWFGYPRPITGYGIRFSLNEKIAKDMGYYSYDTRGLQVEGTNSPWLYASGCVGFSSCRISLLDEAWDLKPAHYTVRMGFFSPSRKRIFDINLQENTVLKNFNPGKEMGDKNKIVIKEFKGIRVENDLFIELVPKKQSPGVAEAPLINFIEIIREDKDLPAATIDSCHLTATVSNQLIALADKERRNGNIDKALSRYHRVIKSNAPAEIKTRALKGMAAIGSVESLPVIEKYIRQTLPIFWNYNEPDPTFVDQTLKVYLAIAQNLAASNPQKAKTMLEYAAQRATSFDLKDKILDRLLKLGANSDNVMEKGEKIHGIRYKYFEGNFTSVNGLDAAQPKEFGVMKKITLSQPTGVSEYGYIFSGYLSVPKDGIYTFYTESNDGSKLYIDGKEIVNNDGGHGIKEESGAIAMRKGFYPITVKYFQMGGGQGLKVSWSGPDSQKKEISPGDLFYVP